MKKSDRHSLAPGTHASMTPQVFDLLRSYIHEKTGIYFHDNKLYLLQSRLKPRLSSLAITSFEDYYEYIKRPINWKELPLMVNAVTINETYFFRSTDQFELIRNHLLPQLIQQRLKMGSSTIRLWSTACSMGDEPYTLALIVKEYFVLKYPHIQFRIIGTDIDSNALDYASLGVYKSYSTRFIPPVLLRKYFTLQGDAYRINDDIRKLVEFKRINLTDRTEMLRMQGVDIAICANVLIYFPSETKHRVVTSIHTSLNRGSYFMVGHSETLFGLEHSFESERFGKSVVYKKKS